MRIIGLDLGTTTLGISISDNLGIVHIYENYAFPEFYFKKAREHLHEVLLKEDVSTVVIGLPLQLDGNEGKRALSTRRFIKDYIEEYGTINVIFQDERFTTLEAKERLTNLGYNSKKIDSMIDAMSAVIILEDYLRSKENE